MTATINRTSKRTGWLAKVLLLLAMGLSPIYVFESGNPQPGDFLFVLFAVYVLLIGGLFMGWRAPNYGFVLWFAVLLFWVALVNIVWSLYYLNPDFLRPVLFYAYNFLVSLAFVLALKHVPRMEQWTAFCICVALIVSGAGALISLGTHIRPTGFFNNPNQLAYYSLLGLAFLLVSHDYKVDRRPLFVLALVGGVIGILAASSLAAFGGSIVVLLSVVRALSLRGVLATLSGVGVLSAVLAGTFLWDASRGGYIANSVEARMNTIERKTRDPIGERKYDRIIENPEHTFLGAGEALYEERFYPFVKTEIHSSLGTLIFSYGLPGVIAFSLLVFSALRSAPLPAWLVLAGPLVYSLTHMGLRTTLFWLLVAYVWSKYGVRNRSTNALLNPAPNTTSSVPASMYRV